jgi:diphosphomevalonate decarboxylase
LQIEISAPSNIALIKYMGKTDSSANQAANPSLSYTLDELRTYVRLSRREELMADDWEPLHSQNLAQIELSEKGKSRYLQHFSLLKDRFRLAGNYLVESANNFPSDCGLASSASSFAALTMAASRMSKIVGSQENELNPEALARMSQLGSGSSCRSFFKPWALWSGNEITSIQLPYTELHHQVIILDSGKKLVSSSEAHRKVVTSKLFVGRIDRARQRLDQLINEFQKEDWGAAFETCWAEFWDMHALFETSRPGFSYFVPETIQVLNAVRGIWNEQGDGPIATMDAGPNVHLLYRPDQFRLAKEVSERFFKHLTVFSSKSLRETLQN